jgi:hypothetical protein
VSAATVSGGSWQASLPVTNVADRRITRVARTTSAAAANTVIDIDCGATKSMRGFGLFNHNLQSTAQWRIKASLSAIGSTDVLDSGAKNVLQMSLSPDVLEWEDTGWWEGIGDGWVRNMHPIIYVHSELISARYVRIEITDTTNPDGYVQVGRAFAGPVLEPAYNDDLGRGSGFVDFNTFDVGEAGAEFARLGRKVKRETVTLSWLTEAEARFLRGISRQRGTDDDVLYVPDVGSASAQQEYGFLGRIEGGLEGIDQPAIGDVRRARLTLRERT